MPHKTGRKENRGRNGCTVCAEQECLLKDKTYKSIRNQNKIRLAGDVNGCSPGLVSTRSPLVSGNYMG